MDDDDARLKVLIAPALSCQFCQYRDLARSPSITRGMLLTSSEKSQ